MANEDKEPGVEGGELDGGADKEKTKLVEKKGTLPQLVFGAGGIYACFLVYGSLQEDVTKFVGEDGTQFTFIWFLQCLEALANVLFSFAYLAVTRSWSRGPPQDMFSLTGFTQVTAKYCTNAAMTRGVSFPVTTLAKSGKMVPVMVGSLFLGGATYTLREYLQVLAIVTGTAIVSLGGKKGGKSDSTALGLMFLVASLVCDGLTGGVQNRLKNKMASKGIKLGSYDFMFWTNLYMLAVAVVFAVLNSEILAGMAFCARFPAVWSLIIKFSICSAFGQSFIFYTIAVFDPLVCSTVTTTRKIFSVLFSIIFKGNPLSPIGWFGLAFASAGILADISGKSKAAEPKKEAPTTKSSPSHQHQPTPA
ncbi:Solute carrier family 35 member B1-like protein [Diplonema papillatum]|nr:Solute carrier family 35 member B1-like protein [Diplonema papillatum]